MFLRYESFRGYLRLFPVTSLILLINISLFILLNLVGGGTTSSEDLYKFGAHVTNDHEITIWRYVTSLFLHIGFQHLLFNCFAIFVFAPPLERILGKIRYFLFYVGSGMLGNALTEWIHWNARDGQPLQLSAGASGAIFGVYAAFLYMGLFRKEMLDQDSSKTIYIIIILGLIFTFIMPNIAIYGHIGGFIGGFLLFPLLLKTREYSNGKLISQ